MIKQLMKIAIASAIISFACKSSHKSEDVLWLYTHHETFSALKDTNLSPASFINLEADGNYTRDFGVFDYGKWRIKDNRIELTDSKNQRYNYNFKYEGENEMKLDYPVGGATHFESQPISVTEPTQNPFSKSNNLWRIPAIAKETDQQIKNRLLNHYRFWELYFSWALKNDVSSIDVRSTPTPIKIYGNGFKLKEYDQLPATWRSYFFDKDDCEKANDMIRILFEKEDIAWARTDNKYKMFISAFQQMQQKMK